SNVPSPSAPSSLPPHAATPPELSSARLCCSPAATAVASLRPLTETGDLAQASCCSPRVHLLGPVFVPLPSCPKLFRPQAITVPPSTIARLWSLPAATAVTSLSSLTGMAPRLQA